MKKQFIYALAALMMAACGSGTKSQVAEAEATDSLSSTADSVAPTDTTKAEPAVFTYENMEGIYDSLDEQMNSESRISLMKDGTATWGMIGSLNYTEYTYTIRGNNICLSPKDTDSEEDCYVYDPDTRTLKNEQGAVYYRQVDF